jgi:hypothetical protein
LLPSPLLAVPLPDDLAVLLGLPGRLLPVPLGDFDPVPEPVPDRPEVGRSPEGLPVASFAEPAAPLVPAGLGLAGRPVPFFVGDDPLFVGDDPPVFGRGRLPEPPDPEFGR